MKIEPKGEKKSMFLLFFVLLLDKWMDDDDQIKLKHLLNSYEIETEKLKHKHRPFDHSQIYEKKNKK